MIKTFATKETAALFAGNHIRRMDSNIQRAAQRKLALLNRAEKTEDLRIPPGNRLEKLTGNREGQWSIRINQQWRLCFEWHDGDAFEVDYRLSLIGTNEMSIHIDELKNLDFSDVTTGEMLPPVLPGELLMNEFLKPMGITQYRLAKEIGVSQRRIGEIVAGNRAVTTDTGLRLSRYFGMSDGFWVGLQTDYDLAKTKKDMQAQLADITPLRVVA